MPAAPVRLEFADDLFARRHRGLGSPVVNQWIWRLEEPYDAARLAFVADGLARGGLSRRLHRALIPGARDVWTNAGTPPALALSDRPLPAGRMAAWLEERHHDHVDPHEGRSWRLAATNLDDGTAVVSLIFGHAVADGGAVMDAVTRAALGSPLPLPPLSPHLAGRLAADARDAAGQLAQIGRWGRARLRARRSGTTAGRAAGSAAGSPTPPAEPASRAGDAWEAPRLVVEVGTDALAAVAARHGGSTNSWFVAVMGRLMAAIGHVPADGGPVPVSLPLSDFRPGDTRSNSTRMTRVEVPRPVLEARDLAVVKALCKEAYAGLAAAGAGSAPIPLALVQMLPDGLIARLPKPSGAACMASSLGILPDDYVHAFGDRVRSVVGLAAPQGASAQEVREIGCGLIAWVAAAGPRTTFTIIAAEPDRVADEAALRALVLGELASWGLDTDPW